MFDYAVFVRNPFNGYVTGADWQAVDILLNRENVKVTPKDFSNWRIALNGYMQAVNEFIVQEDK